MKFETFYNENILIQHIVLRMFLKHFNSSLTFKFFIVILYNLITFNHTEF